MIMFLSLKVVTFVCDNVLFIGMFQSLPSMIMGTM